jgi:hypothetical protein
MNNDIKQISLNIVRDLYGGSRRLAMYPLGHPTTQETLKKPLGMLNEIFVFKHSFTIDLFKERVLGEGVLLDDSVFVSGMALEMKKHKLSRITFYSDIAIGDLYHFLALLVSRSGPYEDNMARILKAKNIHAIELNLDSPPRLYVFDKIDPGSAEKFILEERIKAVISSKPDIIGLYYMGKLRNDEDILKELGIDLRLSFMARYFKETLLHLERDKALELIKNAMLSTNWLDDKIDSQAVLGLRRIFEDYLAENFDEEVLSDIYRILKEVGTPDFIMDQFFNKSSFLKLKTFQESEEIVEALKYSDPLKIDPVALRKTVFKLAASRQKTFLVGLLNQLIMSLSLPVATQRQGGEKLLMSAAEVLANGGFFEEYSHICKEIVQLALLPTETSEPIDLAADLVWLAIKNSRWQEFKVLARTIRGVSDDHLQAENKREQAAVRLSEISSSDTVFRTASELSDLSRSDDANDFFEGLSVLGSRDIIKMLSGKLTHPDINIRSRMIKLLVSMKSDAGEIISEKLGEMVARVDSGSISDEDWYYFRNALRVIKEVRALQAIPHLEIMSNWPSTRIKLEVVKTLETMPAENAFKLLDRLSNDDYLEVKKAAVTAMGLSEDKCMIPYLRDIFLKKPECRQAALISLGRIGEPVARDTLIGIYENPQLFKDLGVSKKEAEEIRATIIRALTNIGDEISLHKIALYSQKPQEKWLSPKEILSSTAKIILGAKKS